ncbi:Galaxin-2 [Exaiptasia diaphana]|nr:Galaxin-2 [Exaiptasia diaphana]
MASVSVFLMSVLGAVLLINFNTNSVQSREINIKEVTQRVRRSEECDAEDEYNSNVLCCAGTRYTLTFEHSRCCGKSAYNPITSICCGGVVQWNLRSQSRCCGRKPYNPMIYDCCGGRLIRRSHNNANGCCNGTPYDPRHFTCCQGKVSWRRGTGWCCGKRVFDGDVSCNWSFRNSKGSGNEYENAPLIEH